MPVYHGSLKGRGKRFAIVVSRFNQFITERVLSSALETLWKAGVKQDAIDVVWVPGALELPFFCQKLIKQGVYHAVIALGCILRGGTYHFECVAQETVRGISQVALEEGVPVATAVITADTLEEAIDRAGLKAGNKGEQAALAALEIASLNAFLSKKARQRKVATKNRIKNENT